MRQTAVIDLSFNLGGLNRKARFSDQAMSTGTRTQGT